ncbi:MAG: hypothetical protein Q9164_004818 [Protoblastenia rupestris]
MAPRRKPLALQKAKVQKLAIFKAPEQGPKNVRPDLIERIKKCFDRAHHATANESEAQAAIKMASKIMDTHNIELAHIMQYEDVKEQGHRGGLSTVVITQPKEPHVVKFESWVHDLVNAVCKFFECDAYSEQCQRAITWTFFGIAEHTVTAAMAFEVMHFLILNGSSTKIGVTTRNSYCMGAAYGLCCIADQEAFALEATAKENEEKGLAAKLEEEERARKAEVERLQAMQPSIKDEMGPEKPTETSQRTNTGVKPESNSSRGFDINLDVPPAKFNNPSFDTQFLNHDNNGEESENGPGDLDNDTTKPNNKGTITDDASVDADSDSEIHADYIEEEGDSPSFDAAEGDFETNLQQFKPKKQPEREQQPKTCHTTTQSQPPHDQAQKQNPSSTIIISDDPPRTSTQHQTPLNEETSPMQWQSTQQLTTFRKSAQDVADSTLKDNGIKLGKSPNLKRSVKDEEAYSMGERDSRDINDQVKRRRIEDGSGGA